MKSYFKYQFFIEIDENVEKIVSVQIEERLTVKKEDFESFNEGTKLSFLIGPHM